MLISLILATFLLVVGIGIIVVSPALSADDNLLKQTGLEATQGTAVLPAAPKGGLPELIGTYVGYIGYFAATIMLILIIYGGYMWMTAGGNEESVKKGQKYIVWAVIGYLIIAASYLIINNLIIGIFLSK